MPSELIINTRPHETRVALVENGTVVELHIERKTGQELMDNIYRGRIVRVLPGMQAAFVDIATSIPSSLSTATLGISEEFIAWPCGSSSFTTSPACGASKVPH